MRFLTFLILVSVGLILYAVLSGYLSSAPPAGSAGLDDRFVAHASSPSRWPFPARSASAPIQPPIHSAPPSVLSSTVALFRRGFSAATGGHKTFQRAELRIARGTVATQLDSGLIMNCSGWVVQSAKGSGVYAGDGRGMNALYANLVDAHEQFQYGRLMVVDRGAVRQSVYDPGLWIPESYLLGTIFLKGYPPASAGQGKGFKVVVAPDGNASWQGTSIPAYTADFTLAD